MIRTKCAVELCALIVDDVYGELASRIFATLLRRGRLTVSMLVRQTRLTPKHIHHGLAVLVRQGLAFFCEESNGTTFYESNLDAAYSLIRVGKALDIIDTRHGQVAKVFAQIILSLGHPTVADVAAEYEKRERERVESELAHMDGDEEAGNGEEDVEMDGDQNGHHAPNGTANGITNALVNGTSANGKQISPAKHPIQGDWHTSGKMDEALWDLLESRLIEPVTKTMFTSIDDIYKEHEKALIQRDYGGSITGLKAKAELKEAMRDRLRDVRDQGREPPKRRNKRLANGNHANGDSKRRKTEYGSRIDETTNNIEQVDRGLVVRLNQEQCLVAIRSRKLSDLASRDIGKTTGRVYSELLRLAEQHIPRCRLDPRMDNMDSDMSDRFSVTTMELDGQMDKSILVSKGIGKYSAEEDVPSTNGGTVASAGQKRTYDKVHSDDDEEYTNGAVDPKDSVQEDLATKSSAKVSFHQSVNQSEDRSTRLVELNKHLALLAEHRHQFLTKCGNNERGEWTIDFPRLTEYMINTEIDTIIYRDFGVQGRRLFSILREKGKFDEPTLEKRALIAKKDMQQKLTEMQRLGFVDVQEVPRDNTRMIARTMFLWYVDHERIASIMLDTIYKAMARCLEVLDVEKLTYKEVLATTERTDVAGYEEEMLDPRSLEQYHAWQEKQEKMLAQISRLDDLVGIFRDY